MSVRDLISHVHLPRTDASTFSSETRNNYGKHGLQWRLLPLKLLKKRQGGTLREHENVSLEILAFLG